MPADISLSRQVAFLCGNRLGLSLLTIVSATVRGDVSRRSECYHHRKYHFGVDEMPSVLHRRLELQCGIPRLIRILDILNLIPTLAALTSAASHSFSFNSFTFLAHCLLGTFSSIPLTFFPSYPALHASWRRLLMQQTTPYDHIARVDSDRPR